MLSTVIISSHVYIIQQVSLSRLVTIYHVFQKIDTDFDTGRAIEVNKASIVCADSIKS